VDRATEPFHKWVPFFAGNATARNWLSVQACRTHFGEDLLQKCPVSRSNHSSNSGVGKGRFGNGILGNRLYVKPNPLIDCAEVLIVGCTRRYSDEVVARAGRIKAPWGNMVPACRGQAAPVARIGVRGRWRWPRHNLAQKRPKTKQ
jgi:hypothetical protein